MALLCCSSVFSLVVLALLCIRGHGIVIDVSVLAWKGVSLYEWLLK